MALSFKNYPHSQHLEGDIAKFQLSNSYESIELGVLKTLHLTEMRLLW